MGVVVEVKVYGVYIMKVGHWYKVGISSDVEQRSKVLKGEVLNFHEVGDHAEAYLYEHLVHKRLREYCVTNEYFDCDYQTVIRAYNDCLFNFTTKPYNHIMYVDDKPLSPPECDGSIQSMLARFKYLTAI